MRDHTSNAPDLDDGYALDLTGPVQHVASELATASGDGDTGIVSLDDMAARYTHFSGDLSRVRRHESLDSDAAATTWLINRAADELVQNGPRGRTQLIIENGQVALAPGMQVEDLRWRGNPVYPPQNIHQIMGDPFNPMSGKFARNVRKHTGKDDTRELEASMRAVGWLPGHPAVKDVRTLVTISGHRRLQVAAKLRAEGLDIPDQIQYVDFEVDGEGDPADVHRMDVALASNFGFKRPTPDERQETALWLNERRNMTQQQIAELLGVSQQTVSRDLNKIITQMGNELEPLITAATAAIRRGLTQSQFGVERGMANNSMMLAKAFAVAQDRIRREAEDEQRARDAAAEFPDISDQVHAAIEEAEEKLAGDEPMKPLDGVVPPDEPVTEDSPDDEYDPSLGLAGQPVTPEPRRAVNPPQDLPPAPQPLPQDDPATAEAWSWSDAANAWVLQRGRFWVTCQLPKDTQPVFPAHLFGVFVIEPAGQVEYSGQRTDDDPDAV
jgi:transcriptional regulator with XRE-family HTH domain